MQLQQTFFAAWENLGGDGFFIDLCSQLDAFNFLRLQVAKFFSDGHFYRFRAKNFVTGQLTISNILPRKTGNHVDLRTIAENGFCLRRQERVIGNYSRTILSDFLRNDLLTDYFAAKALVDKRENIICIPMSGNSVGFRDTKIFVSKRFDCLGTATELRLFFG